MKLTKKQQESIKEIHGEVCGDWQKRIEEIFPKLFEADFKEGDWVKIYERHGSVLRIESLNSESWFWSTALKTPYQFNGQTRNYHNPGIIKRKATKEEIETALINEAKKRFGEKPIKDCTKFVFNGERKEISNLSGMGWESCYYNASQDNLQYHGMVLYEKGQWAEIVNEIPDDLQKVIDRIGKDKILKHLEQ